VRNEPAKLINIPFGRIIVGKKVPPGSCTCLVEVLNGVGKKKGRGQSTGTIIGSINSWKLVQTRATALGLGKKQEGKEVRDKKSGLKKKKKKKEVGGGGML